MLFSLSITFGILLIKGYQTIFQMFKNIDSTLVSMFSLKWCFGNQMLHYIDYIFILFDVLLEIYFSEDIHRL